MTIIKRIKYNQKAPFRYWKVYTDFLRGEHVVCLFGFHYFAMLFYWTLYRIQKARGKENVS